MDNEQLLESHFKFGENWEKLVAQIDERRLAAAVADITAFLKGKSLVGKSFLDIGCGSGLSSLAAFRMGAASIVSVDIDPLNVTNVESLKRAFNVPPHYGWRAYECSIVAPEAAKLAAAEVAYSVGA